MKTAAKKQTPDVAGEGRDAPPLGRTEREKSIF